MDTSFGPSYLFELGPLTLGYERWANLPPSEIRLQSFGHAEVKEDGKLEIKLIGIDGTVQYEKILTPEGSVSPTPPQPDDDCKTIAEIACEDPDFSTLCNLVTSSEDISSLLSDPSQTLTVFAPINEAFENAPSISVGEIDDLLAFHTVAGGLAKSNLVCKELVQMANGKDSRTTCDNNKNPSRFYQRGSDNIDSALPEIIDADIVACNGIIHAVNNVMLPSGFLPDVSPNRGG